MTKMWPSQTASRHSNTEPTILKDACSHSSSLRKLSIFFERLEMRVKPKLCN
jgi:hypothetical protein